MNDDSIPQQVKQRIYPTASKGVADSKLHVRSEQTRSPSYRLAFADNAFLLRDEMRGVRLQLEFQKADLLQQQHCIESTIVIFGGARVTTDSRYYEEARAFARLASARRQIEGQRHFVVTTGGGPGIMEATNRGAHEAGAESIGLNIDLPHEQQPNSYITPALCFQFHYFAIRKMHFLMRAKALVCFPGGFGTLDELFEALTLIQTGKIDLIPVILVGKDHWERAIDFGFLCEEGLISRRDLDSFSIVETAKEAWKLICRFYSISPD